MGKQKSDGEINAEITALEGLQARLPGRVYEQLEAQRLVLADRMTNDDVYDNWGDSSADEFDQELLDCAVQARLWMAGESSNQAPSIGWRELL